MRGPTSRREFLQRAAAGSAAGLAWNACSWGAEKDKPTGEVALPKAEPHRLVTIAGKPRERGKQYGAKYKDAIQAFLQREIIEVCAKYATRDELLQYAGDCSKAIAKYSPTVQEELEGMAEGTGLTLEEVVLITAHEETAGHKDGKLPPVTHCTAIAAGPPDTSDGRTYVGQNWDWMHSVYGLSQMLLWRRDEGPSLISYSYPGLWAGAGLNDRGLALCWTWGDGLGIKSPRVGIPAYVLIAQMLYQETLADAIEEAKRATHAGWFAFVLADGEGRIAAIDGTPEKLAIQRPQGHAARASYASREVLGGKENEPLAMHPQCGRMFELLRGGKGKLDRAALLATFADHHPWTSGKSTGAICKHPRHDAHGGVAGYTVDSMLFDCTKKIAYISRGPGCNANWQTFEFNSSAGS